MPDERHIIMSKTLPEIIDDLYAAIRLAESSAKQADKAALEAKKAAAEARAEGQKAAQSVKEAAENAVAGIRGDLEVLEGKCITEASAVDKALCQAGTVHLEESPFLVQT